MGAFLGEIKSITFGSEMQGSDHCRALQAGALVREILILLIHRSVIILTPHSWYYRYTLAGTNRSPLGVNKVRLLSNSLRFKNLK